MPAASKRKRLRADMVLAGGGVLGIGHVGVASVLEERGYAFPRLAGTSAGAIVAALLASGMPTSRMHAIVGELDYLRFRDPSALDRLPLVGPPASVLLENGFYEGDYLREWLAGELESQGVRTFGDLRVDDRGSSLPPERRYRLVVMATDLTRGELVRLPWDYRDRYGLDPDEQLVADAVRASTLDPLLLRAGPPGPPRRRAFAPGRRRRALQLPAGGLRPHRRPPAPLADLRGHPAPAPTGGLDPALPAARRVAARAVPALPRSAGDDARRGARPGLPQPAVGGRPQHRG